jgi:hypothetical protein
MRIYGDWPDGEIEKAVKSFDVVASELNEMHLNERDFLVLYNPESENYIQIGYNEDDAGGGSYFVEVRIYNEDRSFTHYRAFLDSNDAAVDTQMDAALGLFRAFYGNSELPDVIEWEDVTAVFNE